MLCAEYSYLYGAHWQIFDKNFFVTDEVYFALLCNKDHNLLIHFIAVCFYSQSVENFLLHANYRHMLEC